MKKVIVGLLTALLALTGCSQDVEPIGKATEKALLGLPGVTGGTCTMYYASLSPNLICELTGSGTTKAELVTTMDAVARTIVAELKPVKSSLVRCSITNGDLSAGLNDLGFEVRTVDDLRQNLR